MNSFVDGFEGPAVLRKALDYVEELGHSAGDVLLGVFEFVFAIAIDKGDVVVMPGALPSSTSSFYFVGKGGTFDEWVQILVFLGGGIAEATKEVAGFFEGIGVFFLENVVGDSSNNEMSLEIPGYD